MVVYLSTAASVVAVAPFASVMRHLTLIPFLFASYATVISGVVFVVQSVQVLSPAYLYCHRYFSSDVDAVVVASTLKYAVFFASTVASFGCVVIVTSESIL